VPGSKFAAFWRIFVPGSSLPLRETPTRSPHFHTHRCSRAGAPTGSKNRHSERVTPAILSPVGQCNRRRDRQFFIPFSRAERPTRQTTKTDRLSHNAVPALAAITQAWKSVPREVDRALRQKAAKRNLSLNRMVVEELSDAALGARKRADFSGLVGKWTPDPAFDEVLASGKIDRDKWK